MNFDGSKRLEGAGAGVVLVSPQGDKMKYILQMTFPNASNNEAEYEALIHGMKMAKACGATHLKSSATPSWWLNRLSNDEADVLANIGSQCLPIAPGVFWEEINATSTVNFTKGIVFRFGIPNSIVTDNGSNFTSREFKDYCESVGIKLQFASVAHPQTNGQVEKANGLICNGIKKRLLTPLEKSRHIWVDELPYVLWSLRTTPNAATQETPFFLVHGAKAVLPIEIEHNSPRVAEYDEETSQKAREDDVDALDEARDEVLSRMSAY
ncbi:hypothetical protein QYE76_042167 [Lolium multiflorum]|uniref:Integrase catalytic domain-containing protein n=1 Tax=Lolium multiflorum TaxID=4521 RepID=A0AAD8WUU5_LOLMU|nr:hypothetical protein QYE76_042167 [Lolium multiflorum]